MLVFRYNATDSTLLLGSLTTAKLSLLNALNFNASHVSLSQVTQSGALEVYGNGWLQGGMLVNASVETVDSHAELKSSGVQVLASGGPIGPAVAGVLHVDSKPILYCDFQGDKFTIDGHYFSISWDNDLILYST